MPLPPVVAELRANVSQYMTRITGARAEWEKTAAVIGDPRPIAAAESGLAGLSKSTGTTAREASVLAETSRETFAQMRNGAASVVPGLGELSGVLGGVRTRFTEIGVAAREGFAAAGAQAEALKLKLDQVNQARLVSLDRLVSLEAGSRAWTVETAKLDGLDASVEKLNADLAHTLELQASAGKGAGKAKALVGVGGAAAVGVAVGAAVGYEGVKAALAEQSALALLRNAVDKTKESFATYLPHLENVDGQMRKLGFSDAATAASAQALTTALKDPEKALNLVGLAANIARARHIDLATATGYVQKIATGHVGTLGRLGLASKDAAGHTLTVRQSIDELGKAYSGAATTYAGTLQGKWDVFKAQVEHVLVAIGNHLIPVLSQLLTKFEESATWINQHVVPTLKALWSWFVEKIVPAIKRVIEITVGAYHSAFESASKALHSHGDEVSKVVGFLKALAEFIVTRVLPVVAKVNAFFIDLTGKALVPVIVILSKVVDAFGWLVKAAGDAAAGLLRDFVKPVVDGMLWMAQKVLGAADSAFGWVPGIGGKLDSAKAAIANFATNANATLESWANNASKWGNDHTAAVKDAVGVAKKAAEAKVNIGSGFADGLANVGAPAKKAAAAAKKHTDAAAEARKKAHAAELAALKKQHDQLKREADKALAEANRIASAREAQLQASLAAAEEAARQLDVANKLANQSGQLDIIDGQSFNRGTSFAQLAGDQARGATINLNIAGRVTTERDLLAALHEGLLTYGRTNISTGVA